MATSGFDQTGFCVDPIGDCSHIHSIVPPQTADPFGLCEICENLGENWICLTCSKVFCSRYAKGHMIEHGKQTGHSIVLSFADLSVWCYSCENYVKHPSLLPILQDVHMKKFGEAMPIPGQQVESEKSSEPSTEQNDTMSEEDTEDQNLETRQSEETNIPDHGFSGGFYVSPITNCPHIEELSVPETGDTKAPCATCSHVGENWLCLHCSKVFCSRYVNGDMAKHCGEHKHAVVVSFSDFSSWCYQCDSYISNPKLFGLLTNLHISKFGFAPRQRNSNETNNNHTSTTPTTGSGRGFNGAPTTAEEIEEIEESKEELMKKVKQVAELVRKSEHFVAYTGAGISTSANLPDYRGPNGVWTVASQGRRLPPGITLEQALPTPTHMALKVLQDEGFLKFLVSTNVDGLHRRSGIREEKIAELHGNIYREKCENCSQEYLRPFDVTTTRVGTRKTGRKCSSCGGDLRDSIINFGERLPLEALERSLAFSNEADLRLVLGTSMRVSPANQLPLENMKGDGSEPDKNLVIVNLQRTPFDEKANIRIFAKTDVFFGYLMRELALPIPVFEFTPEDLVKELDFQ